jgi:hypothetical protein
MIKRLMGLVKRLHRALISDPGRLAGGSAIESPLGLDAVEKEKGP